MTISRIPSIEGGIQPTLLSTTGDIMYASSASNPARLGIGSSAQVLTVSGGVPTWATPASGTTYVGASVYMSANQNCNSGSDTTVNWDLELFDTNSMHDNVTNNSRVTVPTGYGGKWLLTASFSWAANNTGSRWAYFYKNGSTDIHSAFVTYLSAASQMTYEMSYVVQLAAADYITVKVGQNSGGVLGLVAGYSSAFQMSYLGA